jgi:hypothetical protein
MILSETDYDLQQSLDIFAEYSCLWKLTVNIVKTKILIFSKGPMSKRIVLYNGVTNEKLKQFCYLGTIMPRNGKFNNALSKKKTI